MSRKKIVHINRHVLVKNKELMAQGLPPEPPITGKPKHGSGEGIYSDRIDIIDNGGHILASVVYQPTKPLSCGAVAWIETEHTLVDARSPDRKVI